MPAPPPSLLPYLAQLLRPSPLHPDPTPSAEAYLRMLIRALCSAADPDPDEALRLLDRLRHRLRLRGYRPNGPDLAAVLRALCSFGHSVEAYRRLLLHLRHAPSPSPFLSTPTASSSRCATGPPPDAVSYTTLLNGYARLGDADVARHLLDEMPSAGVAPNSLTRTVLIKALLRSRRLEETRQLVLRLWPAMEHQQRWPYDGNGLLHPRGFGLACHLFGGVKPWVRGKSGLVILMMYGSTGQMMDLVSLSFFKWPLAEDLGASPVWVANSGISHNDQNILDGTEFARGDPKSQWGSIRATMGHPEPFQLNYISLGNQDCWMKYYRDFEEKSDSKIRALEVIEELRAKRADKQAMLLLDAFNKDRALLPQPNQNTPQPASLPVL